MSKREMHCPHKDKVSDCPECMTALTQMNNTDNDMQWLDEIIAQACTDAIAGAIGPGDYSLNIVIIQKAKAAIQAKINDLLQREVELTIVNLINRGLFTAEQLNASEQKKLPTDTIDYSGGNRG